MTPERCAELVTDFDAPQVHRVPCGHVLPCPLHTPPKSAEASMQERIKGLEETLRSILRQAQATMSEAKAGTPHRVALRAIRDEADAALRGPSDPDRDRETRAEQVRP